MSKIKMIETTPGALDGISIKKFNKGMVYSIPDQISAYLSELFLNMGVAKIARERNIYEKIEAPEKAVVETPEIKEAKELDIIDPQGKYSIEKKQEEQEPEEKKMQIYMLADELSIASSEIVKIAKKFNIGVKNHMSVLSEEEVITIKKSLN